MSNWVFNKMYVYGEKQKLKEFKDYVAAKDKSVISFEKMIPRPNDTSSWAKGNVPGWYKWGLENWGTKWDAWDTELTIENDHLFYQFITAWSAPIPIYDKLIDMFTELDFVISVWESVNYWTVNIETCKGQYTKYIYEDSDMILWKNNLYATFEYSQDIVTDTHEILKAEFYERPDTGPLPSSAASNRSVSCSGSAPSPDAELDDDDLLAALNEL